MIEQVHIVSDAGWTEHWGQSGECTLWLHDVFTDIEVIEPISDLESPENSHHFPLVLIPLAERHPNWSVPPSPG